MEDEAGRLLDLIRVQTEIAHLGLDLGSVLDVVAQRAAELTHASGAAVELAEGPDMVYRSAAGLASRELGLRLKRSRSLSGLCVELGRGLRCDDSETDDRVDRDACRKIGLRSMVVVPLKHRETVVGALKVMSRRIAAFDEGDLRILELLAGHAAGALFQATPSGATEVFHRATHDPLTDLPNRALFYDRLRLAVGQALRKNEKLGVLLVDLDDLKGVNRRLGRPAGDAVMRQMAQRLKEACRETDTVARLGSDQFGCVLFDVHSRTAEQGQATRIAHTADAPFAYEQERVALTASIGLALCPDDGTDPDRLLEAADQALQRGKRARGQPRAPS